jgi:hypothetical protein
MIVASVIPLIIETGRVLALETGSSGKDIHDALQAVSVLGHKSFLFDSPT